MTLPANTEQRGMRVDPAIIMSLIKRQAGTFEKALLETIMNAIDALATQVELTITRTGYTVRDNGVGFESRDQVTGLFETFGFAHDQDPLQSRRTYGAFGIGRGQQWNWASTVYRSRTFEMNVDITRRGLDYDLTDGLPDLPGTLITGTFYEPITTEMVFHYTRALTDQVLYSLIPVTINGVLVSRNPEQEKWTHVTDDAYIRISDVSMLKTYNLGMYVNAVWSGHHGTGGVIVSRKNLTLNMARNEVSTQDPTWKAILREVQTLSGKRRVKREKLSENDLRAVANNLRNGQFDQETLDLALRASLITDLNGRSTTIQRFGETLGSRVLMMHDENSRHGSRYAHTTKVAYVLHPRTLERFEVETLDELISILQRYIRHITNDRQQNLVRDTLIEVVTSPSVEALLPGFADTLRPKNPDEYSASDAAMVRALNAIGQDLTVGVAGVINDTPLAETVTAKVPNFAIGQSEDASMWVAANTIFIDEDLVKVCAQDPEEIPRLVMRVAGMIAGFRDREETDASVTEQKLALYTELPLLSLSLNLIGQFVTAIYKAGHKPHRDLIRKLNRAEHLIDQAGAEPLNDNGDLGDLLGGSDTD